MTLPAARTVPAGAPDPDQPGSLERMLAGSGLRTAVFALSKDRNAKVTLLLFPQGAASPKFAVKVPTTDVAAAAVRHEAKVLIELHALNVTLIESTVPAFVRMADRGGRPAMVVTALPGVPLSTTYHGWRHTARAAAVRHDFAVAEDWLRELQTCTSGPRRTVTLAADWAETIKRRWANDPRLPWITERLAALQDVLGCLRTPRTVVHGDFWCGNLLTSGDRVAAVVDWEAGEVSGEPLRDLARFPLAYGLYLDRHTKAGHRIPGHGGLRAGGAGAGVLHAFDTRNWFGQTVREFVAAGLERLGAPAGMWRHVLIAGVAEVAAAADHDRFAGLHLDLLCRLLQTTPLPAA